MLKCLRASHITEFRNISFFRTSMGKFDEFHKKFIHALDLHDEHWSEKVCNIFYSATIAPHLK